MVDTTRLNSALHEVGLPKYKLARILGISRQSLSNKINNKVSFKASEVVTVRNLLKLSPETLMAIFFADNGASKAPEEA